MQPQRESSGIPARTKRVPTGMQPLRPHPLGSPGNASEARLLRPPCPAARASRELLESPFARKALRAQVGHKLRPVARAGPSFRPPRLSRSEKPQVAEIPRAVDAPNRPPGVPQGAVCDQLADGPSSNRLRRVRANAGLTERLRLKRASALRAGRSRAPILRRARTTLTRLMRARRPPRAHSRTHADRTRRRAQGGPSRRCAGGRSCRRSPRLEASPCR